MHVDRGIPNTCWIGAPDWSRRIETRTGVEHRLVYIPKSKKENEIHSCSCFFSSFVSQKGKKQKQTQKHSKINVFLFGIENKINPCIFSVQQVESVQVFGYSNNISKHICWPKRVVLLK